MYEWMSNAETKKRDKGGDDWNHCDTPLAFRFPSGFLNISGVLCALWNSIECRRAAATGEELGGGVKLQLLYCSEPNRSWPHLCKHSDRRGEHAGEHVEKFPGIWIDARTSEAGI